MGERLDNAKSLYMEAINDGNAAEAIYKYSGSRYIQHSTPVRDGPEGFIEFFSDFLQRNPVREIEIIRGFEDGQYVFLHVVQNLNDGEFRYVTADIFDTDEDAKMIEHWDMIAEMVDESVSGHSQVDGPTRPTDFEATEANKALVQGFLDNVLVGGNYDQVAKYISTDTFIQHNPLIGDGIEGLTTFVDELAAEGKPILYTEVHKVIGCGNFVAVMSRMDFGGVDTAVIDLFRVDAGRIVEHWDVMEEITPESTWVNSGKF